MNIAEQIQKEHDENIIKELDNTYSRLAETMGGMNITDNGYHQLDFASGLLSIARSKIIEGLKLIEKGKTLTQESKS